MRRVDLIAQAIGHASSRELPSEEFYDAIHLTSEDAKLRRAVDLNNQRTWKAGHGGGMG